MRQRQPMVCASVHVSVRATLWLQGASRPVIYYGGGCQDARDELREFARKLNLPITSTLMVGMAGWHLVQLGTACRAAGCFSRWMAHLPGNFNKGWFPQPCCK
jgi:glyoxylate carboligase